MLVAQAALGGAPAAAPRRATQRLALPGLAACAAFSRCITSRRCDQFSSPIARITLFNSRRRITALESEATARRSHASLPGGWLTE